MHDNERIVITGLGLTAPNGHNLATFRQNLLAGISGVSEFETRHMGQVLAGVCDHDPLTYQKRKELRRGTRAGSIGIYCAHEALADAGIELSEDRSRIGVYLGVTEHGNVETENEIHNIRQHNDDVRFWSHHHNPRTVSNSPAGEVALSLKVTGPHYTIGAACAAGNAGLIQGVQMLRLDEVDMVLAGGVSESIHTFGIFASFKSQNALATHEDPARASRPFDRARNGIVVSEGGAVYVLERLPAARARGARIYGEVLGYGLNTDATDFVLPNSIRQAQCVRLALKRAQLDPSAIDLVSTHATATPAGDIAEVGALREVFGNDPGVHVNNAKSFIGHAMGAAGALELAGNLPAFEDGLIHPTINCEDLDPECEGLNLVIGQPRQVERVETILNNSFGMLGINSTVIIGKVPKEEQ